MRRLHFSLEEVFYIFNIVIKYVLELSLII